MCNLCAPMIVLCLLSLFSVCRVFHLVIGVLSASRFTFITATTAHPAICPGDGYRERLPTRPTSHAANMRLLNRCFSRSRTAPRGYEKVHLYFHAMRSAQLVSSIIVGSIMAYFMKELVKDHYTLPWTFLFVSGSSTAV